VVCLSEVAVVPLMEAVEAQQAGSGSSSGGGAFALPRHSWRVVGQRADRPFAAILALDE
jgi:hypothetical protein